MVLKGSVFTCPGSAGAIARWLGRIAVVSGLSLALAACGGGGGGGSSDGGGGSNNDRPTATFTATPTSGKAPLQVAFDGSASRDPDGSISTYAWEFGDNATGSGATTQHTYTTAGSYTARLTVTDNKGATGTATRTITVQPPTGSVSVSVKDANGINIPGASVVVTVGGGSRSGTTDQGGTALIADVLAGTGTVSVSRDTFTPASTPVTVVADQTANVSVTLNRITKAVGGVLTTSTPNANLVNGSELEFAIEVVVVDENSNAVEGLTASAFSLNACSPDANTKDADCVIGPAGFDSGYTVVGPGASNDFLPTFRVNPAVGPEPYSATLMFDQSRSIVQNDPTDARIFSAKEFLKRLGANDTAALAAFASDIPASNLFALIPEKPVTIYPLGNPGFTNNGQSLFPTLDTMANLEGGGTPLYEALCRVMDFSRQKAPAGPRQAAVVFTDGRDEPGGDTSTYECKTIEQVIDRHTDPDPNVPDVDIFTIGLSGEVDGEALARLASEGGGIFLFAEDTTQLITIYGSLGNLLSRSLTTYRLTYIIRSDVADAFLKAANEPDRQVRGTLTVNTGNAVVNLPFIVRIFSN